jgi:hypothetical protein
VPACTCACEKLEREISATSPKSSTTTRSFAVTSTFDGFRSRCSRLCACRASIASASCRNSPRSATAERHRRRSAVHRSTPSTNSIVMHHVSAWVTSSYSVTRFGCPTPAMLRNSYLKRCSSDAPIRSSDLIATRAPLRPSSASYTAPIPPAPTWRTIVYGPNSPASGGAGFASRPGCWVSRRPLTITLGDSASAVSPTAVFANCSPAGTTIPVALPAPGGSIAPRAGGWLARVSATWPPACAVDSGPASGAASEGSPPWGSWGRCPGRIAVACTTG